MRNLIIFCEIERECFDMKFSIVERAEFLFLLLHKNHIISEENLSVNKHVISIHEYTLSQSKIN